MKYLAKYTSVPAAGEFIPVGSSGLRDLRAIARQDGDSEAVKRWRGRNLPGRAACAEGKIYLAESLTATTPLGAAVIPIAAQGSLRFTLPKIYGPIAPQMIFWVFDVSVILQCPRPLP